MNKLINIMTLMLLVVVIQPTIIFAGWTPAERISDENTVYHPRIAANGQYIHVVYSVRTIDDLVYYINSPDNGNTWSEPLLMVDTNESSSTILPVVRTNGDSIFTLWSNYYDSGNNRNISFRRSLDNGLTWRPVQYLLYPRDYHFQKHTLCVSGRKVFVAYSYYDNDLIYKFVKSIDGGQTWSEPEEILRLYDADFMDMACRRDTIFLVWAGNYSGDDSWESYYMKSNNAGDTWSEPYLLSEPDTISSQHPSISINEAGNTVVCWCDGKYSPNPWNGDLFVRYSYDMGETWTDEEQLTFNHWARVPRIVWQGDSIHVVWQDDGIWGSIYYMLSPDNGLTWENQRRLDDDSYYSSYPDIALTGSSAHIVWSNNIDTEPGSGVYYSRWDPTVSVDDIIPFNYQTSLTAYPNPFNSTTVISYSNLEGVEIEIYDITGRLVKTFDTRGIKEAKVTWDATAASGEKVCSGIYFARASASHNPYVCKLLYLK